MRARNIKPGFFKNEDLAELAMETRMLFIGLWLLADREGRLEDRPKRIKAELFAFENIDVDSMLNDLQSSSFLIRYVAGWKKYIQVENFVKHQDPHYKEKKSEIPPIPGREDFIKATGVTRSTKQRILERDDYKCQECGATDGLCVDHIIPASRGGDSSDDNLQVLCISCNTKKGNRLAGEDKGCKKSKHDSGSVLVRSNVDPTLIQRNRSLPSDSLIPDSLIPDSLIPDSLIPDSLNPERESLRSQDAGARIDHSPSCLEKLNNSPADTPCAETVTTPVQAEVSNSQEKLTSSPAKQPPFSGPRQDAYSQEFLMLAEQYPRKDEGVAAAWIAFKALKNSGVYPGNTFVLPILVAWRASPQWMDDGGRYIPSFSKWIREKRWEAGPPEDPQEKLNRQLNDLAAMAEMKKAGVRQ